MARLLATGSSGVAGLSEVAINPPVSRDAAQTKLEPKQPGVDAPTKLWQLMLNVAGMQNVKAADEDAIAAGWREAGVGSVPCCRRRVQQGT